MSSSSSCQCPPVSPCSCTLRTLASVSTSVAAAAQSGPSVTVKKNYSPRLTDDERRRIIDLFLCSQSYEQIQSSFGDKKINVRTIQSVVRTFQKQGRISSKHPPDASESTQVLEKFYSLASLARSSLGFHYFSRRNDVNHSHHSRRRQLTSSSRHSREIL